MNYSLHFCGKKVKTFQEATTLSEITEYLHRNTGLNKPDIYYICNGKVASSKDHAISSHIYAEIRCYGGKGGFGSMLRAIGAQIEKTTNREACRDLSGRRLRDINEEKRLKDWLEKQNDREAECKEKKRKKLEKLMAVPRHDFKDIEYESARSDLTEKISDAVEVGLKRVLRNDISATCKAGKRKFEPSTSTSKKRKAALWIDDELSSTESEDYSEVVLPRTQVAKSDGEVIKDE